MFSTTMHTKGGSLSELNPAAPSDLITWSTHRVCSITACSWSSLFSGRQNDQCVHHWPAPKQKRDL